MSIYDNFDPATTRRLYIHDIIDDFVAEDIVYKINAINDWYDDYCTEKLNALQEIPIYGNCEVGLPDVDPIILHINSDGGSVDSGMSIINTINNSIVPVIAVVDRKAYSMAFILTIACDERYGFKYSKFMNHEGSSWNAGSLVEQKRRVKNYEAENKEIDKLIIEKTLIEEHQLQDQYEKCFDWYMNAVEAYDNGVIDGIIGEDAEDLLRQKILDNEEFDYIDSNGSIYTIE